MSDGGKLTRRRALYVAGLTVGASVSGWSCMYQPGPGSGACTDLAP